MVIQFLRVVVVLALLIVAAVLATPKGRLPLALRGVYRIMKRDRGEEVPEIPEAKAPLSRRLLAFVLVLLAVVLALVRL